jgi:hypothetical protein
MHQIYDRADGRDVGLRQNPVAEIEDVSGAPAGPGEHVPHLAIALGGGCEQRR